MLNGTLCKDVLSKGPPLLTMPMLIDYQQWLEYMEQEDVDEIILLLSKIAGSLEALENCIDGSGNLNVNTGR